MSIPNDFGSNSFNQSQMTERPEGTVDIAQAWGPVQTIQNPRPVERPTQPIQRPAQQRRHS